MEAARGNLSIEVLDTHHDRKVFSCGNVALDRYLIRQAGQDTRKHVAATFVLVGTDSPVVLGYYALSATSIQLGELPERLIKKLPKYPFMPAILIGRLAVDKTRHGMGYGQILLIDALKRCLNTQDIGWVAVIVDAKDEQTVAFYEHHHFIRFSPNALRLFLPRSTIATLF
jgi:GNAT superfamily N-acetyltransferase